MIRNAYLFGNFALENTYLGTRIKEYDEKIDEKTGKSRKNSSVEYDEDSVEEGEVIEKKASKKLKKKDLMPVKISSDEESDVSTDWLSEALQNRWMKYVLFDENELVRKSLNKFVIS